MTDPRSFPRAQRAHRRLHPGCATVAPAGPDRRAADLPALGARHRPGRRVVVDGRRDRHRGPGGRPARDAGGRGRAAVPGRAGPARAQPGGRRGHRRLRDRPGRHGGGLRALQPAVAGRSRPRQPAACASCRRSARSSTRAPTRPAAGSPTRPTAACTSWAPTGRARAPSRPPRSRTSRGAWPSSWPPRRWAATAATGGPPTATRSLAARVDESPVQRWYIADPATPVDAGHRGALPGGRQRRRRRDAARPAPRRRPHRRHLGPRRLPLPHVRASWSTAGAVVQVMSRDQRRAEVRAVDPATGATSLLLRAVATRCGWTSSPACRPCCPTGAW